MEKEKKIYASVATVLALMFVISLVFFVVKHDFDWLIATFIAILLVGKPLNYWYDRQVEKKNPLSFRRVKKALNYVVEKYEGTKEDFIREKGEEMYNHFLSIGYIHEPHCNTNKDVVCWEVTRLGIIRRESVHR